MLAAVLVTTGTAAAIKHGTETIPVLHVAFFRFAVGSLAIAAASGLGLLKLRPRNWRVLIIRGVVGGIGATCYWAALSMAPLANVIVLSLMYPAIAAVLSHFLLGERLSRRRAAILVLPLVGVALMAGPFEGEVLLGNALAFATAFFAAAAVVCTRQLTATDSVWTISLVFLVTGVLFLAPFVAPRFGEYEPSHLPMLLLITAVASVGQLLATRAYKDCTVVVGSLVMMLRIVTTAGVGYVVFHETMSAAQLAGGALIILGVVLIARTQ